MVAARQGQLPLLADPPRAARAFTRKVFPPAAPSRNAANLVASRPHETDSFQQGQVPRGREAPHRVQITPSNDRRHAATHRDRSAHLHTFRRHAAPAKITQQPPNVGLSCMTAPESGLLWRCPIRRSTSRARFMTAPSR